MFYKQPPVAVHPIRNLCAFPGCRLLNRREFPGTERGNLGFIKFSAPFIDLELILQKYSVFSFPAVLGCGKVLPKFTGIFNCK